MNFDVIIIGGGAAGISAALWCDDLGLNALVLESDSELGGQLLMTHNAIENHLGTVVQNGTELRDIFVSQLRKRKVAILLNAVITNFDVTKKEIVLENGDTFSAHSVIIASGIRRRKLNIPGEEEFQGKGIIGSGKDEGESAKRKSVVIVGGGDAAFENALILSEFAERVTLVHRRDEFSARPEFIEAVRSLEIVKILPNSRLTSISGDSQVKSVTIERSQNGEKFDLPTEIVLIRIGVEPNIELFDGIVMDNKGFIEVDYLCRTNIENVYAVGDVANPISPTVSTAVGTGATAVKMITSLLN